MDYAAEPLSFKLRKALRYVRLYGVRRTRVKVRSQYHMARTYESLPATRGERRSSRHVGLIGSGKFAYAQIAYYLQKNKGQVIRGAMDVEPARAASIFERYDLDYHTDDAARILDDPNIDLVYIASNHASHAEYAIEALARGKHVHIEKPHVVDEQQLRRLCEAIARASGRAALGFNRVQSPFGREIQRCLSEQSGAAMLNWFIAGHEIDPEHWYFRPEEGGRILGNLCHWTDFVYQMTAPADRYPLTITPTRAEKSDSDIAVTYTFGDGTIAAITFSAKGHTFEGVKERFAAHRGDALITMDDFQTMRIDVVSKRRRWKLRHRDHGHEETILRSYGMSARGGSVTPGAAVSYVWETGELFLKTREALLRSEVCIVSPCSESFL